jgi:GT2 family glycosyltransferase
MENVAIIILNWNNAADTIICLRSIDKLNYKSYYTIVVDNGSTDSSKQVIRQQFPDVIILDPDLNLGYAEGNNVGIRYAIANGAKYILLLNNDTIIDSDSLGQLVSAAETHADAAFLGPKIYHLDLPQRIQSAGGELDRLWRSKQRGLDTVDQGQFEIIEEVDYLIGAALLMSVDHLKTIGLFDPTFFMYREDVDLCMRARKCGFKVLFVPSAKIWHRNHYDHTNELARVTYYVTRNSLLLIRKHHGGALLFIQIIFRY